MTTAQSRGMYFDFDIESQPIPETHYERASRYFSRTLEVIKTKLTPAIYSATPQTVKEAVKNRFWIAPMLGFGLAALSESSWLLNTITGGLAELAPRGKFPRETHDTVQNIAATLFALHAAKGVYNILSSLSSPSIQNTLGAAYDITTAVKCIHVINNFSTHKVD